MQKRAISLLLFAAVLLSMFCGTAPVARAASNRITSDECVDMIKDIEGFSLFPYYDNGQYTVGYGTTCPPEDFVRYSTYGIPEAEAEKLLRNYLKSFESSLNSFINKNGLTMNQGQFDALLSFTYNVGTNWMRSESTFRTAVLEGATGNDFLFAIARWCTASGRVLTSLIERRLIEANMYLNGNYSKRVPSNYKYVVFEPNLSSAENSVRVQAYDAREGDSIRATPTANGYTFQGWYTKPTGGTRVVELDASLDVITLYGHWSRGDGGSVETEEPVSTGVITASRLNVRSGAGTWNSLVGYLYEGDEVEIYETINVDGTLWGRVSNGWISLDYVNLNNGSEEPKEEEKPEETEPAEDTVVATGVVTASVLKIRSGAGTGYSEVGSIPGGTEVEIYETTVVGGTTWGRVSDGWISLDYVTLQEQVIASGVISGTDRLNVRSAPGTYNELVGYLYAGDKVKIYEITNLNGTEWGKTDLGWISLDYVTLGIKAPELSVSNVASSGKIRLTWTEVSGAEKYYVYRATERSGEYKRLKTTEATTHINGTAEMGKTYYYYVEAVASDGTRSAASNKVECTRALKRPTVSLSNVESTGKIRISWNAVEGAVGYEVYSASSKNGTYSLLKTVNGTALNNTSAVAGETYYYKVKALAENSAANSAFSSVKYRTCDVAQPQIEVGNIEATGKIRISWNAVEGATGYEVYRAADKDGAYKLLKTVKGTSLNNTSAVAGETYYYKVVALGSKDSADSVASDVKYRTCDIPQPEVSVKLNGSGKPRLSWNEVPGAVSYEVYRAEKGGDFTLLNTVNGTAMTNVSAESGVTYSYRVVALAARTPADSAASPAVSITSE